MTISSSPLCKTVPGRARFSIRRSRCRWSRPRLPPCHRGRVADRHAAAWPWLAATLTEDALHELLPETAKLPVTRYVLPNLHAVNFVIEGILGQGAAAAARFDPQAKALGESLRSRYVDVPESLLAGGPGSPP
ncbi:MAG: AtuA-related protein [Streptosporangiaceae bacterium]